MNMPAKHRGSRLNDGLISPKSLLVVVIAVAAIAMACSGGGQSQGGPVPQDQLGDRVAAALCAGLKECCQSRVWAFNAAHCEAAARQSATSFVGRSGTCPPETTYDADTAGECVQQMQSIMASCGDLGTFPPAICDLLCKATQPIGGACQSDKACLQPATGQAFCDFSTGQGVCTLVPRGKFGDACTLTCTLESCGAPTTPTCYRDDGLYCAGDSTCHQLVPIGDGCPSGVECAKGLSCAGDLTCQLPPPPLPIGGDCAESLLCDTGAYCNTAGVCEAQRPAGAPCTGTGTALECRGYCNYTTYTCVEVGRMNVTAQVCSGGSSSSSTNQYPVIDNPSEVAHYTYDADGNYMGGTITYYISAHDPDGDPLTVTWTLQLHSGGASLASTTGLTNTVTMDGFGSGSILITVTDGKGGEATTTVPFGPPTNY